MLHLVQHAACTTKNRMKRILEFITNLIYFFSQVRARLVKMGLLNSINIFLRQEIARMQKVITLVRITLTDLKLAIEGTIIMSEVGFVFIT